MNQDQLISALEETLGRAEAAWLAWASECIGHTPDAIAEAFPQAGRRCGRGPLPGVPHSWTVDDAARTVLLLSLPLRGDALASEATRLYRHGDPAEKRAILRALALLPVGEAALPLVADALRSHDTRLIAAAVGPYGGRALPAAAYRQAVVKCLFLGIPLSEVAELASRADAELARMVDACVAERLAAGRPVPDDAFFLLSRIRGASQEA